MDKNILDLIKSNSNGLAYIKDRDETMSNYQGHSTTQFNFKSRKFISRYDENDDWNKTKEVRSNSNRPPLNRVVYRSMRGSDAFSSDIFKRQTDSSSFLQQKLSIPKNKERLISNERQNQNEKYSLNSDRFSNTSRLSNTYKKIQGVKTEIDQPETPKELFFQSTRNKGNSNQSLNNLNTQSLKQLPSKNGELNVDYIKQKISQDLPKLQIPKEQLSPEKELVKFPNESEQETLTEPTEESSEAAILEQISNQDWFKLLPEEILNNKNIDLDKFFIENSEYFYNLLCMNAQLKGTKPVIFNTDQNKIKYSQGFNTTYSKNFFKKSSRSTVIPQITDKMMETVFLGQKPIDFTSLMHNDYKDHGQYDIERRRPPYQQHLKPFMGLTNYNSNFVNWQSYNKYLLRPPAHLSTVEAPLMNKTIYRESFGANQKGEAATQEKKSMIPPIPSYPLQSNETNYNLSYKNGSPQASTDRLSSKSPSANFFDVIPSYDGQYKSTNHKDFASLKEDKFLAHKLKKIWRKKIISKLEELRDLKEQKKSP